MVRLRCSDGKASDTQKLMDVLEMETILVAVTSGLDLVKNRL